MYNVILLCCVLCYVQCNSTVLCFVLIMYDVILLCCVLRYVQSNSTVLCIVLCTM